MKKEAADIIANYSSEPETQTHNDYCRREDEESIYGVSFPTELSFFQAIATIMMIEDEAEREIVGDALQKIKIDNLGKGYIYY